MLILFKILLPFRAGLNSLFGDTLSEFHPTYPSQEGTSWLCLAGGRRDGILRATLCSLAPFLALLQYSVLGLHGVSLNPVAGLTPGLFPLLWQCPRSLSHLPLMHHPNGNSNYIGLQFGPQPRATPWQAHLPAPFTTVLFLREGMWDPLDFFLSTPRESRLGSYMQPSIIHGIALLDAADLT